MEVEDNLAMLYREARDELDDILAYWALHTPDRDHGGFVGRIDENNVAFPGAEKGAVLHARILYAFSAAYKLTKDPLHLQLAGEAFRYIAFHFVDPQFGGVYWLVSALGEPLDTRKQAYALAFALYGCCAYFEASGSGAAKSLAIDLYRCIEAHSRDEARSGYLEAFTREWEPLADLRLSEKDANEKKTMNTHLHILEAYTSLFKIWPDPRLKEDLTSLLQDFTEHFVDAATGHLRLFFDEQWNPKSSTVSFGHNIEAAWLLTEAATALADPASIEPAKRLSGKIAAAALKVLDSDGGLSYEEDPAKGYFNREKHWWVQAEAVVGFLNQWQLTGDGHYLDGAIRTWQYIKHSIKDRQHGEWFWGRNADGTLMQGQDKVGRWKCPYHNSRACIEVVRRLAAYC